MGLVFYNRTKPWGYDGARIALDHNISFFGYAIYTAEYDGRNLKSCIADPGCSDEEWKKALDNAEEIHKRLGHKGAPNKRQANKNRNMVQEVKPGDIVLMPRPSQGMVYAGKISSQGFELVNDPPWAPAFREMVDNGDEEPRFHEIEVGQCWRVEEWKKIPFTSIPGWIRRSLFGLATYNRVPPIGDLSPYDAITKLMENPTPQALGWTLEPSAIGERLKHFLGPSSFEHLIVSLLQLEQPERSWQQVGGSGDGGVDGIAMDQNGEVASILQCKWSFKRISWEKTYDNLNDEKIERILSGLIYREEPVLESTVRFVGIKEISNMVAKYAQRLPIALSLRIGSG